MCEYLGYSVTKLKRVRIMHIHLDLPIGKWRNLTAKELEIINSATVDSSKVYEDFE
jgi:23S rRNA pseudouridine2604 synthase